jgi:hypothetical protein
MNRKELVNNLKCDELCFVAIKRPFKEKAMEKLRENHCPPCMINRRNKNE